MLSKKITTSLFVLLTSFTFAQAQIDLTVSNVMVNPPYVKKFTPFWVQTTVSNIGTTSANTGVAGVYLSMDNILDANDQMLTTYSWTSIPASGSVNLTINCVITSPFISQNPQFIIVKADDQNQIIESNENNNTGYSTTPIIIMPTTVDLTVEAISSTPTSTTAGSSITVAGTSKNLGPDQLFNYFYIGFYLSSNTTYESTDIYLGQTEIGYAPVNQGMTYTANNILIPAATKTGKYYIIHYADYNNQGYFNGYIDLNQNNNTGYSMLTVSNTTEINDVQSDNTISIYPNPTTGLLTLKDTDNPVSILIKTISGNTVFTETMQGKRTIDISHLNSGIYIAEISSKGITEIKKLIKE